MKKTILTGLIAGISILASHAQAVYVDSNTGIDTNVGTQEAPVFSIHRAAEIIRSRDNNILTMKLNPGIYVLESYVSVSTEKLMTDKRIVIEAGILLDDTAWSPEAMPIIINKSKKGLVQGFDQWIVSFLIDESNVTVRGIKFLGYFYPNSYYFPIARINKAKTDLVVEQCMFVGDEHASHIQVGVIAHGNEIKIDHCVFYNARNAVVYWQDSGDGSKTGNSMTHCIVYGAFQTAIWSAWPDKDFVFGNNIITDCKYAWIKNDFNPFKYTVNNSILVNNQYYQGVWHEGGVVPEAFETEENEVIKEGDISLQGIENIDNPLPINYLHMIPDSPGYDIGAGLFKNRK